MSWRPLLEGDLAARAKDALHAISNALPEPSFPSIGGKADVALFHGYFGNAGRAEQLLEHAVDALASTPMPPALYGGFTGIAWVAEHVSRVAGESEADDVYEEIDRGVLAAIAAPWTGDYDLINGLVGFGVYARSRVPRLSAIRCLEEIVDRFYETAEIREDGVTWFTHPQLLYPHQRQRYPTGGYNLGVAHGVPGVIAFLADVCRLGIRLECARPLLDGAVRWLLSYRLSEQRAASFPAWIVPGVGAQPSRLAWCYGAPGVAATLLSAARAVGNEEWEQVALDIALRAATADAHEAGVQDAGLCHGAFGLAHVYNRIYQAGGGDAFADAARDWYSRGLDMRQPGRGIAGFESWELGANLQLAWRTDPSFLTGAAGIGLALLAAVTPIEPEWDRLLMLSLAAR
jgi:lantibiotic biosynthesis protein